MPTSHYTKSAEPIFSAQCKSQGNCTAYYYFIYDNEHIAGIGLFYDENPNCTIACVKDPQNRPSIVASVGQNDPILNEDIQKMVDLYFEYFED